MVYATLIVTAFNLFYIVFIDGGGLYCVMKLSWNTICLVVSSSFSVEFVIKLVNNYLY
jgi:hypothetical protein